MNRRGIPSYAFHDYGQEELRRRGVMAIPWATSVALEPRRLHPHYHDFHQVFFLRGPCHLMHDFRDFHLSGVSVVFVNPGQVHTLHPGGGMTGMQISFTREFFDRDSAAAGGIADFPFLLSPGADPVLAVPYGEVAHVESLFAEGQKEFDDAKPGADEILRALLSILFVRIRRLFSDKGAAPAAEGPRAARLEGAFRLAVESHYREKWTLADYARHLKVTANHLNDTVRERTGETAGEVIRARILLDARRLLLHSDLDVAEIAYHLGFRDASYFSRFFRRADGSSPAEFRRKIREKYR